MKVEQFCGLRYEHILDVSNKYKTPSLVFHRYDISAEIHGPETNRKKLQIKQYFTVHF